MSRDEMMCSFCGKNKNQVKRLVSGPGIYICDECVTECNHIMFEAEESSSSETREKVALTPTALKAMFDEHVIGQEAAKRALAIATANHYKRINNTAPDGLRVAKSNVLILGPTGSGKTLLAQTLADAVGVPLAIADATSLTQAGYVGDDVENVLLRLIQAADGDIELAERGIVYIDEIDKIATRGENMSISRDVSGEGVQQALLKILEGSVVRVAAEGGRKHPNGECYEINTENILFICGGAFSGIENIITKRMDQGPKLGFTADHTESAKVTTEDVYGEVTPGDLARYGMIPEFIGRLPIITTLARLDEDTLVNILTEPKNALVKQYEYLFSLDGVQLQFKPDALRAIAHKAMEQRTGARGLRTIMENLLADTMFSLSEQGPGTCVVTEEMVTDNEPATFLADKEAA